MIRVLFIAIMAVFGCASQGLAGEIRPEAIVTFSHGTIVCLDREHLTEISLHVLKGELTKAAAYMVANGGDCLMASSNLRFKVLSAEYNIPGSDLGLLEITGSDMIQAQGAWAYSLGAEQVK